MTEFVLSAFADEADGSLNGQIKAVNESGVSYIEIRNVDGKSIVNCTKSEVSSIRSRLDAEGIKVSAIGSPIGKIGIKDEFGPHLDLFKKTIDIAHELNAEFIRLFSFFIPSGDDPAIYRDDVMERMTAFLDAADGSGVVCCHENEKVIYGDIPERVLDLHKTLGSRLKGIFDPANYIQCKVDPLGCIQPLLPYIQYLHVKDAKKADDSVVPSGNGDGGIKQIIKIFQRKGGRRFLSVEPHLKVFPGFKSLGDNESIKEDFTYGSSQEAFRTAVSALKNILYKDLDYREKFNEKDGCYLWTK